MQQETALHALSPTEALGERPLRDRVGLFIRADEMDVMATIREAEQAGIHQIWSQSPRFADTLTLFAAAATQTERIRLGTAIVPAFSRHPLELVRQALAIHDLAPARLRLGIGPGNSMSMKQVYGLSQTSPLLYLKEYLEVVRGVLWEGNLDYQGTFFTIRDDSLVASVIATLLRRAQIPLLISAIGPKAFQLAGQIADGALSFKCPIPYLLQSALPSLQAGAQAAGRPVPVLIAHVEIAMSTDASAVLATMRPRVQSAARFRYSARVFAQAGFAKALDGDEENLDALVRTLVISGDETTVREGVQALLASGLDELMLSLVPIADGERERKQLLHLIGSLEA